MSIETDGPINRFGECMEEHAALRGRIRKAISLIVIGIVFLIMAFVPTADAFDVTIEPPSFFTSPLLSSRYQDIMWYAMYDWYLHPIRDGYDLTWLRPKMKDFMADGIITIFEWNDITFDMLPYRHGVVIWGTDIDSATRKSLRYYGITVQGTQDR